MYNERPELFGEVDVSKIVIMEADISSLHSVSSSGMCFIVTITK